MLVSLSQGKWTQVTDWMSVKDVSAKVIQKSKYEAENDKLNMATTSQVLFDMPRWTKSLRIEMKKPVFWPTE